MVEFSRKGWITFAPILALIGYIIPLLHIQFFPVIHFYWGYSLLSITIVSWLTDTSIFFRLLLPLPLVLALIGWAGYLMSENKWHLRCGFIPILGVGIVFVIIAIYVALYGEVLLPLNCIAFFASAFASHRAKISQV